MSDLITAPRDWVPITLGGGSVALKTSGGVSRFAHALLPTGTGTVSVIMVGSNGAARVLPAVNGQPILGQFISYESSTGISALAAAFPE